MTKKSYSNETATWYDGDYSSQVAFSLYLSTWMHYEQVCKEALEKTQHRIPRNKGELESLLNAIDKVKARLRPDIELRMAEVSQGLGVLSD